MNIDQTLEQLSHLQYPRQVDVTERVMAQVMGVDPDQVSVKATTMVYTRSYDDEGMGSMIAQANDYSSWNTVEEMAVNPYEYLYEE